MKKLVIIGSGGLAKEISYLVEEINKKKKIWDLLGYIDKNTSTENGNFHVIHDDYWLLNVDTEINIVLGIGSPVIKKKLIDKLRVNPKIKYPNLIHPLAIGDWENIRLGKGNVITAGANFTTDIYVGDFNLFNLNLTVGHDTKIGDFNVFNPSVNISGNVTIMSKVLVGTGAQILERLSIESNVIIGAGAVVSKNIEEEGVYVGIPAKKLGN